MEEVKKDKYIGMQSTPKYDAIIKEVQIKFAPISKTDAIKKLIDAGAEKILGRKADE